MSISSALHTKSGAITGALLAAILVVPQGCALAAFSGGGGTTGIILSIADWVPLRDKDYGGWGVVAAGGSIASPLEWTKDAPSLALKAGSYDVYWVQDYDTRDKPIALAVGVAVEDGKLTTVKVDTGVRLDVASWIPARDKDYGWWGAVEAGATPDARVNWTKHADALVLPPGDYDIYWVQDYDTRDTPMEIAAAVKIAPDQVPLIGVDSGIKLDVADRIPARDKDYGWWGAVEAGAKPDARVNWTKEADALLLPPGNYDVYWVQDYATRDTPIKIAGSVPVPANGPTTVKADSGATLEVASWVPARDKDYGWWGAVEAGAKPDARVNWTKDAAALFLPPGSYDFYWVQNYATKDSPVLLATGVAIRTGEFATIHANTGIKATVDSAVAPLDKDSGWWGAAPAWRGPDHRVNWSVGQATDAMLLPPGSYDIYWHQNNSGGPELKAREVVVAAGQFVDVAIGTKSIVETPSVVTTFSLSSQDAPAAGAVFPDGIKQAQASYDWKDAKIGMRLGVRWYKDGAVILEQGEPVAAAGGTTAWFLKTDDGSPLPSGSYRVQLVENGEARVPIDFTVGSAAAAPSATVPTPHADAAVGSGSGAEAAIVSAITEAKHPDFSDDFSDPASGWTVSGSATRHMGYADKAYHIGLDGTAEGWTFATNGKPVADGIVQVNMQDSPQSVGHPFGVVVRAQGAQSFHAFVVSTDESYSAFHVQDGKFGMDGTPDQKMPAGVFRHDGANRIEVFLSGASIVYFVNGHEIDRATALWPTGSAGVISGNVRPGKSDVSFDDWQVWIAKTGVAAPPVPAPGKQGAVGTPPLGGGSSRTLAATAASTKGAAVDMNGYLPPNLAGFKLVETHQTEASSAVEGKETTVEVFSAANGDQVFVLATHNIRWAVGWAPGGDATKGYFLRDPLCSGKYTEKYSPAAPFSAPGCALPQ